MHGAKQGGHRAVLGGETDTSGGFVLVEFEQTPRAVVNNDPQGGLNFVAFGQGCSCPGDAVGKGFQCVGESIWVGLAGEPTERAFGSELERRLVFEDEAPQGFSLDAGNPASSLRVFQPVLQLLFVLVVAKVVGQANAELGVV